MKGLGKLLQKMCSGWRVVTVLEKVSTVQPVNFGDKYFVIWQFITAHMAMCRATFCAQIKFYS